MTVSWLQLSTLTWTSFLNIFKKKKKAYLEIPGTTGPVVLFLFLFFFLKKNASSEKLAFVTD